MLLTWGRGPRHGHDTDADIEVPRQLSALPPIRQIACGELHSLALSMDGRVLSWGSGLMGALGTGTLTVCRTPTEVYSLRDLGPADQIAAGRHHSLALSRTGEVYRWGMCGSTVECDIVPRRQPELGGRPSAIGCGDEYCAALTPAGGVAWGGQQMGAVARLVVAAAGASSIACGARRLLLVDARGTAHLSAPLDGHRYLNDLAASATPTAAATPTTRKPGAPAAYDEAVILPPPPGQRFIDVAGSSSLYAALTSSGEVVCFGDAAVLVPLPALSGVVRRFAGGPSHLLGLDLSGRLVCTTIPPALRVCGPVMTPSWLVVCMWPCDDTILAGRLYVAL